MWMKNFVICGLRKGDETPTLCQMELALKIAYWMTNAQRACKLQVGKQINKQTPNLFSLTLHALKKKRNVPLLQHSPHGM